MAYLIIYYFLFIKWYWQVRGTSSPAELLLEIHPPLSSGCCCLWWGIITQVMSARLTRRIGTTETEASVIQIKSKWI